MWAGVWIRCLIRDRVFSILPFVLETYAVCCGNRKAGRVKNTGERACWLSKVKEKLLLEKP